MHAFLQGKKTPLRSHNKNAPNQDEDDGDGEKNYLKRTARIKRCDESAFYLNF